MRFISAITILALFAADISAQCPGGICIATRPARTVQAAPAPVAASAPTARQTVEPQTVRHRVFRLRRCR
jgi:hypothetical protein